MGLTVTYLDFRMKKQRLLDDKLGDMRSSSNSGSSIEDPSHAFHNLAYDEKPMSQVIVDPHTSYAHGTVPARTDTRPEGVDPTVLPTPQQ